MKSRRRVKMDVVGFSKGENMESRKRNLFASIGLALVLGVMTVPSALAYPFYSVNPYYNSYYNNPYAGYYNPYYSSYYNPYYNYNNTYYGGSVFDRHPVLSGTLVGTAVGALGGAAV